MESKADIKRNSRIEWMDFARALAVMCVVLNHSVQAVYPQTMETWASSSVIGKIVSVVGFALGRQGVPIFIGLTGALLLSRRYNSYEQVKKFYKKNLLMLLITIEIWSVLYDLFLSWFRGDMVPIETIIKNVLFIEKVRINNMWYVAMVLGLYLFIPYVAEALHNVSAKILWIPMFLVAVDSTIIPSLNIYLAHIKRPQIDLLFDLQFGGAIYGLYMILGLYIYKGLLKKMSTVVVSALFVLSFGGTLGFVWYMFENGTKYALWYNFVGVLVSGLLLLELFSRVHFQSKWLVMCARNLSGMSLAVFFMHRPVQMIFEKYNIMSFRYRPITVVCWFVMPLIISVIFICIGSKIKFVKKYVFLIK